MTQRMKEIARTIVELQVELDREIEFRRRALGVRVHDRLVEFERGIVIEQRKLKTSVRAFLARSSFGVIITAPVIYSMLLPLVLLDIWISVYQAICFRAYGIARAQRRDYIAFDRGRLAYLNWVEALNCAYCAYANGVIAYAREIGSRTEQYWCPIKHALRISDPHQRYYEFLEFGDAEGYRTRLAAFRELLAADGDDIAAGTRAASPRPEAEEQTSP
ncbi:hypothetical protein ATE68_08895 [Sphingopyxis sp. H038]|uniref:hypothetical protein n=2 Tax=Sphingopyxis TaxID=165697 RepID=UPI0007306C3E|nr:MULTISPECIES: hypothetical protein [unclassified Sphingopyxis]KTE03791.1 hypothetical protein ATE78_05305 [Sphingopyxis sp. H012]KTE09251.1 hypothetical protein ATE70_15500 [Sphingopyxis sp. H053]KTE14779.1 hypothetical protein ATE76_06165 [Sphingopyxis sp. H093]KTE29167.1 hypothetical protein ATE75_08430 [Sphingopyxis sp. H080]KTE35121.1 hypothetical protein ATE68_08895 [Sphingopyxis sp. H038]